LLPKCAAAHRRFLARPHKTATFVPLGLADEAAVHAALQQLRAQGYAVERAAEGSHGPGLTIDFSC
jgi:hypothetical protein